MKTKIEYTQILIDKINKYKSISNEAKQRVLKQFDGRNITELLEFQRLNKLIPSVLKANEAHLKRYNRVLKDVEFLESHAYAPELNVLHLKTGHRIKTPGKTTIPEAIEYFIYNSK